MAIAATDAAAWVLALVPFGAGAVGLAKWWVGRIDRANEADAAATAALQRQVDEAVEKRFLAQGERLADMSRTLTNQQRTINYLQDQLDLYVRHAGRLEILIAREAPHIQLPELEIPPMPKIRE